MPQHSYKKLLLALVLICGSSGLLQVLVFSRKQNLHYQHYSPNQAQAGTSTPALITIEGTLLAIGLDRIHLRLPNGRRMVLRCEAASRFKIGSTLRATCAPGDPPSALEITSTQASSKSEPR